MNIYLKTIFTTLTCAYFWYYAKTYQEWHFIDTVNLIFHEAGHTIFFFLGNFLQVVAGSATQILIPLLISIYFFYKNEKLNGSIIMLWVGQNVLNVSLYIGDAALMQLELLGGDAVVHDWNYILTTLGLIRYTNIIASISFIIGICIIIVATIIILIELHLLLISKRVTRS